MTTLTVSGIVAPAINVSLFPSERTYGIDGGGFFGPAGGNLAGAPFTVVWTGTDCNCSGTNAQNPMSSGLLTINGMSYDFGVGTGFSDGDFFPDLQQIQAFAPGFTSLTTRLADYGLNNGTPGHDGVFYIHPDSNALHNTQAFLTITPGPSANVPGPIVGAGMPGLILLLAILAWGWRRYAT